MAIFAADASKPKLWRISEGDCVIGGAHAMALNVEISISRQLNPIATIGWGIQWAAQPATGNATFGTILTKDADLIAELGADGNSCDPVVISLTGRAAACEAQNKTLTIDDAYCSQIAFSASGQQGYVGQNLTVMFTSLTIS